MKPIRIQRKRNRGWKMPPNTVYVGRPSKWGNHYVVGKETYYYGLVKDREMATELFRQYVEGGGLQEDLLDISELKGKNLACWCPLDKPCHADILLKEANL